MENYADSAIVNVGCGEDQTIRELAETIQKVVGFSGVLTLTVHIQTVLPKKFLIFPK